MPRYVYECQTCQEIFEVTHSIKDRLERCDCADNGELRRLPSMPIVLNKQSDESAGKRVRAAIKEAKEELELEKNNRGEY